jgi:hypothetical protein
MARIAYMQGDVARADSLLGNAVNNLRRWTNSVILQWCLHQLGFVKHLLGDEASATALLCEGLAMQDRQLHRLCIAESLDRFAWVATDQDRLHRAARLLGAADELRRRMGAPLPLGDKPLYDRYLEAIHAALNNDEFDKAWAEGTALSLDQAVEYALTMADEQPS